MNLSTELNVGKIAAELSITPDYLTRLFKKEIHCDAIEYINQRQIRALLKLLSTTDLQIQSIASNVGLPDVRYFGRLFKKQDGISAKEYQKSVKKGSVEELNGGKGKTQLKSKIIKHFLFTL